MQTIRMGRHIRDFACLEEAFTAKITKSGAIANTIYITTAAAHCNARVTCPLRAKSGR